jgi:hypothetical protein
VSLNRGVLESTLLYRFNCQTADIKKPSRLLILRVLV